MRSVSLLVLVALLLSFVPANLASADCGPGSPPDCTCIVNTSFMPEQISLPLPTQILEPIPVLPPEPTSGQLILNLPNYFPSQTTILSNVNIPSTPVLTFDPGSYYYVPTFPH